MILPILTVLIFLVTLGLLISAAYFFVVSPIQKQKLRTRLVAVQELTLRSEGAFDDEILRRDMLSDIPALHRILVQFSFVSRIQLVLQQAAVDLQVAAFLLIVMGAALFTFLAGLIFGLSLTSAVIGSTIAAATPWLVIQYKRQRRFSRFEEQFPDAMDLLARAVRAGHAFTTAFSLIGDEMADPVGREFRTTHRQQNLGMPLREALLNLTMRVPLVDVRIFVSAIQIQKDSGGNLGEILDNLSGVIRERFKIHREVRVLTAEGRLSMYVLLAMPFLVGSVMYLIDPENLGLLFKDPMGQRALIGAGVMQFLGYLIIRKMIRLKV